MANIKNELNNIKNAMYGKDVRSSIHDGIDAINNEVESTTGRQVDLENTFDQLIINAGNSNAEIVDARVKSDGTSYSKLGDRLDAVDSQLAHIKKYVNIKEYGVIGDGITDDTEKMQIAINDAINKKLHLYIPSGSYVISKTLEFNYVSEQWENYNNSFKFLGDNTTNTFLLSKINNNTPVMKFSTNNHGGCANNIEVGNFVIKPFNVNYKQTFDGIMLENCISNHYHNIEILQANNGIYLSTKRDLSISDSNTGYTEQNLFEKCNIFGCVNCVTYKAGFNDDYNSSFNGNQFQDCAMSVNSLNSLNSNLTEKECTILNMESGNIYNNIYNIRCWTNGSNCNLMYINATGTENTGTILYEFWDKTYIKTGNMDIARFMLDGYIVGFGGTGSISWERYNKVLPTDINSNNEVIGDILSVGKDKFYSLNLTPPDEVLGKIITNKDGTVIKSLLSNIEDMWKGIKSHNIFRYFTNDWTQESGFIAMCREFKGNSSAKFTIGLQNSDTNKMEDFEPGFDIFANGSKITSRKNNLSLGFIDGKLTRNGYEIIDTEKTKLVSIKGMKMQQFNSGFVVINGATQVSGTTPVSVDLTDFGLVGFDSVNVTFLSTTSQPIKDIYVNTANSKGFKIVFNNELNASGYFYWTVTGRIS